MATRKAVPVGGCLMSMTSAVLLNQFIGNVAYVYRANFYSTCLCYLCKTLACVKIKTNHGRQLGEGRKVGFCSERSDTNSGRNICFTLILWKLNAMKKFFQSNSLMQLLKPRKNIVDGSSSQTA